MVSPGQGWLEVGTPVKVIVQAGITAGLVLGLYAKSVLHFGHYVATATPGLERWPLLADCALGIGQLPLFPRGEPSH